jgi:hypothetical protein
MTAAHPFHQGAVFDPAATHLMGEAFDCACRSLPVSRDLDVLRTMIARRIIELARGGERDPERLCERAIEALTFSESAAEKKNHSP